MKCAYTYCQAAHELLAKTSQALRLWHCAREPSVGIWVVVMDYVEGSEADNVLTDPAHIQSLRGAITTLHDHGFVFGDLRPANVLIVDDRAVLIDLDWCGQSGEVKYPSDIMLDSTIGWHSGVRRGGPITTAHDEHLFYRLTHEKLRL